MQLSVDTEHLSVKKVLTNFNLLYFFAMVLYAAQATYITRELCQYSGIPISFMIPLIMTMCFYYKNHIKIRKDFLFLFSMFFLWFVLQAIKFRGINWTLSFFLFYQLFIAYAIAYVFKRNAYVLYEKYVTWLSVVCLIIWSVNLLSPAFINAIMAPISVPIADSGLIKYNILIASVLNERNPAQIELFYRNPGFSWEPGMYASIVIIAIFINLMNNKFVIKRNYRLWILLVSLISTFSTTGYATFLLSIVPFYMLNHKFQKMVPLLVLFIPVASYIVSLDFVGEKILNLQSSADSRYNIEYSVNYTSSIGDGSVYVPQRFDGIAFEFMNIVNDPIIGYGLDNSKSYIRTTISDRIAISNGNVTIIGKFGIMGLLLIIMYYISAIKIIKFFGCKHGWLFFVLFISVSMSYDLNNVPLFMMMFLCPFYNKLVDNR